MRRGLLVLRAFEELPDLLAPPDLQVHPLALPTASSIPSIGATSRGRIESADSAVRDAQSGRTVIVNISPSLPPQIRCG